MKKVYLHLPACVLFFCFLFSANNSTGQSAGSWAAKYEPQKVFIENKGQFNVAPSPGFDNHVAFAYDGHSQNFYFTKTGVVFNLKDIKKPKLKKDEEREMKERMRKGITAQEHKLMELEENKMVITQDELTAQWIGANPDVEIIPEGKKNDYHSYTFKDESGTLVNQSNIPAFEKLTYKNLYPNIDVVYEMHPQGGIKYSVVVHPGGDAAQVKLRYSKNARLANNGTIKTKSAFGDFIDHAPATFYQDGNGAVASSYVLKNNVIAFQLGNYDHSKTVVIDPWTQTPAFNTQWQCVWECQRDAASNVYVIGGVSPMQLIKYNSAGTLQWTYNTPYDTANFWLGTFAVDNAGNSYVTAGSVAEIEKVNTSGSLVWNNTSPGGIFTLTEFWSISFNCDQTQLVIGGTGGTLNPIPYIYNIDMTNGNVLNSLQVTQPGSLLGIPPQTQEVRAITACGNGNYYFLTHDSIGYIHQGLTSCLPPGSTLPFHVSSTYNLSYKCEDWRVNNTGIKAIKAFGGYVYTHRGNQVHKRNFNTGAIIATGTIPGGVYTLSFGQGAVSNSGIDIDSCGNVYVGATNGVVKFDANLNQLATYSTSFNVYDVQVSPNGDIIAAGSTGNQNSGARTGYVQTFAAAACHTIAVVCCDATICPHAPVCITDAPFTFTSATAGGVWSGTGITNTSTGLFSPSVAGVGTFTIYYTLPCGRDSTTITVNSCSAVSVCKNSNGSFTASGGTAPYTWYLWDSTGQVCQGGIVFLGVCTGTWVTTYGWSSVATGASYTPPNTTDSVKVVDNSGTTVYIYNQSTVVPCTTCNLTVAPGAQKNVTCFGASTGNAHVTVTGGTGTLTYTWSPNVSTTDSAVNLAAGTYTVTVHDAGGCTGTATFTITQPTALTATNTVTPASCGNSNGKVLVTAAGGTPVYTYTWSPNVSTTDSATALAAGTYLVTVTDANHCTATISATVTSAAGVTASLSSKQDATCFGAATGKIFINATGGTGPYTYTWSPNVSTKDSAVNLTAGTYTVTVKDANNCTSTVAATINQPAALAASDSVTPASCGNSNGKVVVYVAGGTATYTYTWSPNVSTTDSAINLATGTYSVTVKDAHNCTVVVSGTVAASAGVIASLTTKRNVSCFGGNNGYALISATGGVLPYTYTWSPNVSTTDSATALTAGTYTVTAKDANNCTGSVTITITQPASALTATDTTLPAYCGNSTGKVYVNATGGTPTYTYTWSPNISTTDSAVNLAAGPYLVTVTDANHCTATLSATVSPQAGPALTLGSKQDVKCNGGSTGKIYVTASGGVGPYTYTWSPNVSTTDSAINLPQGNYSITVRDVNGCTALLSVTINQPAPIGVSTTTTPANCGVSDGTATATVTGGVGTIIYQWSVGTSTSATDTALAAGSYTVTVTDANQCTAVGTAAISNIGGPAATIASQTNVSCNGGNNGKIVLNVTGGTTPYTYTWSPNVSTVDSAVNLTAATYSVTVHDASSCIAVVSTVITQPQALSASVQSVNSNCGQSTGWAKISVTGGTGTYTYLWSTPQTTDSITALAGGKYYVTVTDSAGCRLIDSVTVGTNNGPVAPTISASGPLVFCQGGSVVLTSSAATGNTWSTSATTQSITVTTAGTYTVTQTVGGCTSPPSAAVVVTVNPVPPAPTITASGPLSFCAGGSVTLTSSSASGNVWSNNATTQSITVSTAGTFTVSDTVSGCPSPPSAPVTVSIITAPPVVITASQPAICPGSGSVTLNATTASATTYVWNTSATQPIITIDSPGIYWVTVTANGCSGTDSINITAEPQLGVLTLPDSFSICRGDSVTLDATTDNAASYLWSGVLSATTPVITADSAGVYTVKVSNNCGTATASTIIYLKDCQCRIVMPNAFTPNGDGRNDFYGPDFECANAKYLLMSIFNRWGEKIFETNDLNGKWDGKYKGTMQPPGVYVYYLEFVGEENGAEKNFKLIGSVTLIR